MFLALLLLILPAAAQAKVFDPLKPGPYPVGVTTTVFVDYKRTDAITKEPRTLVTEIWYPATDDARDLPKNKLSNFFPGGVTPQLEQLVKLAFKKTASEADQLYWDASVRDARVREGKFPVIFFSHGNRSMRWQSAFWCDYLASHGYVIVSADHTGNAALTILNGKLVLYQSSGREQSWADRPKDVSFLLDQMTLWNNGADSRFAGKLDLSKPVAAGMSFGSATAIRVADDDPRFKAVLAMAAAPPTHTNLTVPSLYMLGAEDQTIKEEGNKIIRDNFAKHTGPGYLLELKNGGHYSFTDMFKLDKNFGDGIGKGKRRATGEEFAFTPMETTYAIINSYSVAFLGAYVKGEREYLPFLQKNHWQDEIIWRTTRLQESAGTNQ
jgi:predicted dienelactone hydrolase